MHWMVRTGSTTDNGDAATRDVWSFGTADFLWTLHPDNANIAKISLGDSVIAYSYEAEAFTHIGAIVGVPANPKAPGATASMRLIRLADPIRRASLIRSAAWRTDRRTPRSPFSAATTFSQPINVTDRWETIAEALLPYDRQRFDTIVKKARVAAEKRADPDRSWPRSMPA